MIQLQILSKIINNADASILENNMLDKSYFPGYEAELEFILNHKSEYGVVPDKATFLAKFPNIELVEVQEPDSYLVDSVREDYLYRETVPILKRAAEFLKDDSNVAAEYLINAMKDLQPQYKLGGVDIISQSDQRFNRFLEHKEHPEKHYFTTGFPELDDLIHGIQRGEEFFVIFARLNQGKSWVLEKICTHVWQIGYNVGYVSPEMGADSIGYRFDALYKHFSNNALTWGKEDVDEEDYRQYIEELKTRENKFIVSTPLDFGRSITVSKLRNWVKQNKLDMIAIDGIKYLSDERSKRNDNTTTTLTNISEDLMSLSMELQIPILVVVQANRGGVIEKGKSDTPEMENIRDSDGIGQNATKSLSLNQKERGVLVMEIKKNRFGHVGGKLTYDWDIDVGEFTFIPSYDDAQSNEETEKRVNEVKKSYQDKTDVF